MNQLSFTKMTGCGNDYIYLNGFDSAVASLLDRQDLASLIVRLSDRHFGIGGDGVVWILPADHAHAQMRMFNLDGSEGKMCGNAIRCVAKYLFDHGMVTDHTITIDTLSGVKTLDLTVTGGVVTLVKVDMGPPILSPAEIPVTLSGDTVVNLPLDIEGVTYPVTCISMGNPHAVVFLPDATPEHLAAFDLATIGPKFEHHPLFPARINTEFVTISGENHLSMRVWERGSGETLACGTGACATAVAAVLLGHCDQNTDIQVDLLGGTLTIRYTDDTVFMTGGCTTVFTGTINLPA